MDSQQKRTGHGWYLKLLLACVLLVSIDADIRGESWDGEILEYGEMRQVLGLGRHEGRIRVGELAKRPHCYAVGALAQLAGEVTILDGKIVATRVGASGKPTTETTKVNDHKATMLVGAYVAKWSEHRVDENVAPDAVEAFLRSEAHRAGLDVSKPFPFLIEGDLAGIKLHVINGACPMRTERLGIELPVAQQPYRASIPKVKGQVIGVYAAGATHRLTHHGTETHMHAVLKDKSGSTCTGHIERLGVSAGAVLRLPVE